MDLISHNSKGERIGREIGGNMIPEHMKEWIDNVPYEELLRRWRTAPAGSPWFQGETGKYYEEVMVRRRNEVGQTEHVRASKTIG